MNVGNRAWNGEPRFELRYRSLSVHCPGYTFPCDSGGHVDIDALGERARDNYLYARAMVGCELLLPQVLSVS